MSVILLTSTEAAEWKTHHANSHDSLHMLMFVYACQNGTDTQTFLCSFSTYQRSDSHVWSVSVSQRDCSSGTFCGYLVFPCGFLCSRWAGVTPDSSFFPSCLWGRLEIHGTFCSNPVQSSSSINHCRYGQLDDSEKCRNRKWLQNTRTVCPFVVFCVWFLCCLNLKFYLIYPGLFSPGVWVQQICLLELHPDHPEGLQVRSWIHKNLIWGYFFIDV